ncbi:MAG: ribosome biogenesis factor YjgA [Halopseudomonas sp.]|uniref:ribosome biogenesis factor YjgA n=1 Tax=Halopseudomonas sp. TaxID=2901191 RepID=UPI0030010B6A
MTEFHEDESLEPSDEGKSKSQIKREMDALQEMGRRLLTLKPDQLSKLELTDKLRLALAEAPRHTARGALKRHMSFVGKLVRDQDTDAIQTYLDLIDSSTKEHAQHFHQMERWRDRLLTGRADELELFIIAYPAADRQQIRHLVRQATKEAEQNKAPAASRKLFKMIRQLVDSAKGL